MNPLKAQIKMGALGELGNQLDDKLESLQKDQVRFEGFEVALKEIRSSTLPSIMARVDSDRDEEKFDLATAALIKDYLAKVDLALDNLRIRNAKLALIAEGRVAGLKDSIAFTKKMFDGEKAKIDALGKGLSEGTLTIEDASQGVRPDMTALEDIEQRRAEAKKAKDKTTNGALRVSAPEVPKKKKTRRRLSA